MRWISRRGSASPCTGCVSMLKIDLIAHMMLLLLVCLKDTLKCMTICAPSYIFCVHSCFSLRWFTLAVVECVAFQR